MSKVIGATVNFSISLNAFLVLTAPLKGLSLVRYFIHQIKAAAVEFSEEDISLLQDKTAQIAIMAHKEASVGVIKVYVAACDDCGLLTEQEIINERLSEFSFEELKAFFSLFNEGNCIEYKRSEFFGEGHTPSANNILTFPVERVSREVVKGRSNNILQFKTPSITRSKKACS